jgi:hypothetical protein
MAIELDAAGLPYRVDSIVESLVIVEIKSVERMNPVFDTQVLSVADPSVSSAPRGRRGSLRGMGLDGMIQAELCSQEECR